MKKIALIIICCLIFAFCNERNFIQKKEYNYFWNTLVDSFVELKMESFSSFNELFQEYQNECEKHRTVISFEDDSAIYRVEPINFCPDDNVAFDYFIYDVVWLTLDSIKVNYEMRYSIKNLSVIMNNHLINKELDENYSRVKNRGFFEVCISNESSIKETKDFFLKIVRTFNEINQSNNDSLRLNIYLRNSLIYCEPLDISDSIEIIVID